MGTVSIPIALHPDGHPVPIEEAERHKPNFYTCPECGHHVNPRKGEKRTHYYAHAHGALENNDCPLGTQQDVREMVDEYRRSTVEKDERERRIRVHIRQVHGSWVEVFGVLPTLDWDDISDPGIIDRHLEEIEIETDGVVQSPSPHDFRPQEPEVTFQLDPDAESYSVKIDSGGHFDQIEGNWKASGLSDDDVFVGDQSRAKRRATNRQIRDGEWIYAVSMLAPRGLPDVADEFSLGRYTVIGFPLIDETEDLLSDYIDVENTDKFGFNANVMLPAATNPTSEAPIRRPPDEDILIGVEPAGEIDPVFEIVAIPKDEEKYVELEPTGKGNPRFYRSWMPSEGTRRISIHQRHSNRHRLVQLHSDTSQSEVPEAVHEIESVPGVSIQTESGREVLTPLDSTTTHTVSPTEDPASVASNIGSVGPDGLTVDIEAIFPPGRQADQTVTRYDEPLEDALDNLGFWVRDGCTHVVIMFDGFGSITIVFDEDANVGREAHSRNHSPIFSNDD